MRPSISSGTASVPAGAIADQQRTDDAEDEPPHQNLHPPHPISETSNDNDEDAREQCRDRNGDVHDIGRHCEVGGHRRRNVQGRLGKEPEGEYTENNAEKELVVTAIESWLAIHRR